MIPAIKQAFYYPPKLLHLVVELPEWCAFQNGHLILKINSVNPMDKIRMLPNTFPGKD
jgi:hypothetical protein